MKEKIEELLKISERVEALKGILIDEVKIVAFKIATAWKFHPYKCIPDDLNNFEDYFEIDDENIIISWQDGGDPMPVTFPAKCLYNEEALSFALCTIERECARSRKRVEEDDRIEDIKKLKKLLAKYPNFLNETVKSSEDLISI